MNVQNNSNQQLNRITVFIEIHARSGEEAIAREAFTKTIETSEKPGLLSYEIFEDVNEPDTFYSTQEWESLEAFQAHMHAASSGLKQATAMLRDIPRTSILRRIG